MHSLTVLILVTFVEALPKMSNSYRHDERPNIIIFMADDLGFSDLSCFGSNLIKTPNIDKLAENGLKLTRMYSSPSDAGSMAALLTGREPLRMGFIQGKLGWQNFWSMAQPGGLSRSEMNMALYFDMNRQHAFLFGRWNLGSLDPSIPPHLGFSGFYGTLMGHNPGCSSNADDKLSDFDYFWIIIRGQAPFYSVFLILIFTSGLLLKVRRKIIILSVLLLILFITIIRIYCWFLPLNIRTCKVFENQSVKQQVYNDTDLTKMTTEKAVHYLKFRKSSPFLLLLSYHQPGHPSVASHSFKGKSGINTYYDSILELDWSVGQVMETLKKQGLVESTLVIFLSDNGPVKTHPYTGLPVKHSSKMTNLQGEKGSLMEGGLRVPAIFSWKHHIPSNLESSVVTSLMDIFPTIQMLQGNVNTMQKRQMKQFDGKDLSPLFIRGTKAADSIHTALLHYCDTGDVSAASVGDYKVYFVSHNKSNSCMGEKLKQPLVYNIAKDPGETTPLPIDNHKDVISRGLSTAVKFETTLVIKRTDINSQFDQIPLPWDMWTYDYHHLAHH